MCLRWFVLFCFVLFCFFLELCITHISIHQQIKLTTSTTHHPPQPSPQIPSTTNDIFKRAWPAKVIKEYSRSFAGKGIQSPMDLRSPQTLLLAVEYLLFGILDSGEGFSSLHGFLFDRFRAIILDFQVKDYCLAINLNLWKEGS